jgi:pimeloyl-ACP methyl ester carboxylesterase
MAKKPDGVIATEESGIKIHGFFFEGATSARDKNPLLVLIHGGGTNALYFNNEFHSWDAPCGSWQSYASQEPILIRRLCSIPNDFNSIGFDVLNINRPGYGGNPIPNSKTPLVDAIPVYTKLINKVYEGHSGGKGGVILIGHSLGAATALILAALEGDKLPLLGISALGIIPSREKPTALLEALDKDPENPRMLIEDPDPATLRKFMGIPEFLDPQILTNPAIPEIFEPGERVLASHSSLMSRCDRLTE